MSHRQFIERLLIALSLIFLAWLMWQLRGLLILVFGSILVAVILRIIANPIERRFNIPDGIALLLAVLIVLGFFGVAFWLFGAEVVRQASTLRTAIPEAWQAVLARLEAVGLADSMRQWSASLTGGRGVVSNLSGVAMSVGSAVFDSILVIVGGIYLAAQPDLYRSGLAKLFPAGGRSHVFQAMDDSWAALRLWLKGRVISMALVGLLTGLGLWLIGIPGALALALIAFILEFVPFVGPIVAAVPAVLLALALDPVKALWTAGLYLLVQQIEGNLIEPLVQQRAVDLPPALLLFSIFAGGLIFGVPGVLFAAPLLVVIYVMVKRLYVREALDTPTPIPGENQA
jgi:predicted PurR-regulated permease PerM